MPNRSRAAKHDRARPRARTGENAGARGAPLRRRGPRKDAGRFRCRIAYGTRGPTRSARLARWFELVELLLYDSERAVFVGDRLIAGLEVDNAEVGVSEGGAAVGRNPHGAPGVRLRPRKRRVARAMASSERPPRFETAATIPHRQQIFITAASTQGRRRDRDSCPQTAPRLHSHHIQARASRGSSLSRSAMSSTLSGAMARR